MTDISPRQRWAWRSTTGLAVLLVMASIFIGPWRQVSGTIAGSADRGGGPPCPRGQTIDIMASPHLSEEALRTVRYNSRPPTSGPHLAFAAAPGIYDQPVPDGLTVHALEHGRVAIQYGSGPPALATLGRIAREHSRSVLLAPYPGLPAGHIALTAWGCLDLLDQFDESRILTFVDMLTGRYDHGWRTGSQG